MHQRLRFLRGAVVNGVKWAFGVLGVFGSILLVLGLFGVGIAAITLLDAPVWALAVGAVVVVSVVLFEGAFREYRAIEEAANDAPATPAPLRKGIVTSGGSFTGTCIRTRDMGVAIEATDTATEVNDADIR